MFVTQLLYEADKIIQIAKDTYVPESNGRPGGRGEDGLADSRSQSLLAGTFSSVPSSMSSG